MEAYLYEDVSKRSSSSISILQSILHLRLKAAACPGSPLCARNMPPTACIWISVPPPMTESHLYGSREGEGSRLCTDSYSNKTRLHGTHTVGGDLALPLGASQSNS